MPTIIPPSEIKAAAERRVMECLEIAKLKAGISLKYDGVIFFDNSRAAGYVYPTRSNVVYLNLPLMMRNEKDFLEDTIPHEVAHLVARAIQVKSGRVEGAHGKTWKAVMSRVYGLNPVRCHSYEVSGIGRKTKTYKYICSCKKFEVGSVRHNKMMKGAKYTCKLCKKHLVFLCEND